MKQRIIVGIPPDTQLLRIDRLVDSYILWISTKDFIHGTYLQVYNDGEVLHCTERNDECGPDVYTIKPSDDIKTIVNNVKEVASCQE